MRLSSRSVPIELPGANMLVTGGSAGSNFCAAAAGEVR